MRRGGHGGIGLLHIGVGHEAKATGALGLGFTTTTQSVRVPKASKWPRRPDSLVCTLRPPMNGLHTVGGVLHLHRPGLAPALGAPRFRRRRDGWLRFLHNLGPAVAGAAPAGQRRKGRRKGREGKRKRKGEGRGEVPARGQAEETGRQPAAATATSAPYLCTTQRGR